MLSRNLDIKSFWSLNTPKHFIRIFLDNLFVKFPKELPIKLKFLITTVYRRNCIRPRLQFRRDVSPFIPVDINCKRASNSVLRACSGRGIVIVDDNSNILLDTAVLKDLVLFRVYNRLSTNLILTFFTFFYGSRDRFLHNLTSHPLF